MELKKYYHADLAKKYSLFLSISLVISLSLVLSAFEWKQYEKPMVELVSRSTNTFEELVDVPATEIPPPPEMIIQQPKLVEVPDEQEIKEEIKFVFDIEVVFELRPSLGLFAHCLKSEYSGRSFFPRKRECGALTKRGFLHALNLLWLSPFEPLGLRSVQQWLW